MHASAHYGAASPQVGLRNVFGGGGGGHKSATRPSAAETEAAAEAAASTRKESAAVQARVAELKRKQEAGELTDAEMAELGKAERRLATLGEAQASCDLIAISLLLTSI